MAWIREIKKENDDFSHQIYSKAENRTNKKTANVLRVPSLRLNILKIHMALYEKLIFEEGQLVRSNREMIGVVVSKSNVCPYCESHQQVMDFVSNKN